MAKSGDVQLGDLVQDQVTGLKGIVIGITTWLNGCRRGVVQPKMGKDGKAPDAPSFDEPTVDVLRRGVVQGMNTGDSTKDFKRGLTTGGPSPTPTNYATPRR